MNIIFFGSSEFATNSLKAIAESGNKILLVVTQPDRRKGRHLKIAPSPLKEAALKYNLKIFQPENPNDSEAIRVLKEKAADLFVVVSYGHILKKELLEIPLIYPINLHASLLPKYRGAAPINWVLINGEKTTGVSVIKMTESMDAGPIILKKETAIDKTDDAITLSDKLSGMGAELLLNAIGSVQKNKIKLILQDQTKVSFAPKLKKQDGNINWQDKTIDIHNKVRGLVPWPCAYTYSHNKLFKLWKTKPFGQAQEKNIPGKILDLIEDEGIVARTGDGTIILKEVQLEGSKKMSADSFMHGHRVKVGDVLGK